LIACPTRRWTSRDDGSDGAVTDPTQGQSGRHLTEAKRPPSEEHDTSSMVLPNHLRQGDSGISETHQHSPVVLEDLFLLLGGTVRPVPLRLPDKDLMYDGSANSGSFRK
jgi:hypothetical protein